ncbi:hypothetical protein A2U01_0104034, partial [Trifolium medium]|nr:hypothetical protein [Trifolium medium]
ERDGRIRRTGARHEEFLQRQAKPVPAVHEEEQQALLADEEPVGQQS